MIKDYGQGDVPLGILRVNFTELHKALGLREDCIILNVEPTQGWRHNGVCFIRIFQPGYPKTHEGEELMHMQLEGYREEFQK